MLIGIYAYIWPLHQVQTLILVMNYFCIWATLRCSLQKAAALCLLIFSRPLPFFCSPSVEKNNSGLSHIRTHDDLNGALREHFWARVLNRPTQGFNCQLCDARSHRCFFPLKLKLLMRILMYFYIKNILNHNPYYNSKQFFSSKENISTVYYYSVNR